MTTIGRIAVFCVLCGPLTLIAAEAPSAAGSTAAPGVPLLSNLGSHHRDITTSSKEAQRYFDQGLRLTFAFNHEEAINSFREALKYDSGCAMCYWGIALAMGPNINLPMAPELEPQAHAAAQKAQEVSTRASPTEKAFIEALSKRYAPQPGTDRTARDAAYADAMRKVWQSYPKDTDAGTLFAEALMDLQPWDYWTAEGQPKGNAPEIVATLEQVLELDPNHPGACHYYIHAVEASPKPERAVPCAERLAKLMPGAGHLVYMPAHIYLRVGRYHEAAEHNIHAVAVDHEYLSQRKLKGIYPAGYYPHNVHFLWAALTMEGRSKEALKAAQDLHALVSWDEARAEPAMEEFTPTLLFARARFGKWDDILMMREPPAELLYTRAIWHYARGLAYAANERMAEAAEEHARLSELIKEMPADRVVGITKVADLSRIAERVLAGEIAARRGDYVQAIPTLQEGVQMQDDLRYYEPPPWPHSVRHFLGHALLEAGRAADAEQVYRQDLRRYPENGWALHGLVHSLEAQGRKKEADAARQRYVKAWQHADVRLVAPRI